MSSVLIRIKELYISPGHNFFGHHGLSAGTHPLIRCEEINCLAGRGIEGDRFLDYKKNYKGQITFFASEIFEVLAATLHMSNLSASVLRRNVLTAGIDLNTLIGRQFEIQGIQFIGHSECSPCHWMDQAFAPGTEQLLKGHGGLRAQILTGGTLRIDS